MKYLNKAILAALALTALPTFAANNEGNGGSNGGDPLTIIEKSIQRRLEDGSVQRALLNYIDTIPAVDKNESAEDRRAKALLLSEALHRDIRTPNIYEGKPACIDKYNKKVHAAAVAGDLGGKICFDTKMLAQKFMNLGEGERLKELVLLAFHEHVHHVQKKTLDDARKEEEANLVAAYVSNHNEQEVILKWAKKATQIEPHCRLYVDVRQKNNGRPFFEPELLNEALAHYGFEVVNKDLSRSYDPSVDFTLDFNPQGEAHFHARTGRIQGLGVASWVTRLLEKDRTDGTIVKDFMNSFGRTCSDLKREVRVALPKTLQEQKCNISVASLGSYNTAEVWEILEAKGYKVVYPGLEAFSLSDYATINRYFNGIVFIKEGASPNAAPRFKSEAIGRIPSCSDAYTKDLREWFGSSAADRVKLEEEIFSQNLEKFGERPRISPREEEPESNDASSREAH